MLILSRVFEVPSRVVRVKRGCPSDFPFHTNQENSYKDSRRFLEKKRKMTGTNSGYCLGRECPESLLLLTCKMRALVDDEKFDAWAC